ncbi:broad specificity phosphatase PhoE [Nocardioides aurantiacus]|uniref:Broad specificity phosphatase PhoE n=1 Tax=Nocardioides aurantiacus TaxID=86796 RepID=A0A3N2CS63_9ACTN|nr:broad specificity phosphatase PhoE [Nocardioides aurantiacus]
MSSGSTPAPSRGWGPPAEPTTLVLVRHGVTDHTLGKRFSGGLASANPPLNEEGRAQALATGEWLAPLAHDFDVVVSSPVRRTRETAEIVAEQLRLEIEVEHGIAEMEFGSWDGLSFAEVQERFPDDLSAWLGDLDAAPHGGESMRTVQQRVLEGRDRILEKYAGRTVVAVSHVTPIKVIVAEAMGASLEGVYRMELGPASVTVVSYATTPDGEVRPYLRLFNGRPTHVFG